jgi:hypothetical protein
VSNRVQGQHREFITNSQVTHVNLMRDQPQVTSLQEKCRACQEHQGKIGEPLSFLLRCVEQESATMTPLAYPENLRTQHCQDLRYQMMIVRETYRMGVKLGMCQANGSNNSTLLKAMPTSKAAAS